MGVLLGTAATASGSMCLCVRPLDPSLQVSSSGYAEVGWTTRDGHRRHAVVSPRGRVTFGARIQQDASSRARSTNLPLRAIVRRTPDGRLWALQLWRPHRDGQRELRFSRWRGKPTRLEARATYRGGREVVRGKASFHGRPLFGTQETRRGSVRIGVYVDCFRCALNPRGWARATRVPTRGPTGSFAVRIRPRWQGTKYRISMVGPNLGWTRAPDARIVVPSASG
jgi:hypothetical protein